MSAVFPLYSGPLMMPADITSGVVEIEGKVWTAGTGSGMVYVGVTGFSFSFSSSDILITYFIDFLNYI